LGLEGAGDCAGLVLSMSKIKSQNTTTQESTVFEQSWVLGLVLSNGLGLGSRLGLGLGQPIEEETEHLGGVKVNRYLSGHGRNSDFKRRRRPAGRSIQILHMYYWKI
jgi:hypothetical protein